jgi:hypothetical protein
MRLEQETDYEQEAVWLQKVRPLFHEDEGIVVPRVYPQYSTSRVLTMERLGGLHLDEFLATNPSQERRDEFGRKITRSWYRMLYAGRCLYADMHPGNFLFLEDGQIGVIDFGFMLPHDDVLWELVRKMDRPLTTGRREDRLAVIKEWSWIGDDDQDRLRLADEYFDWVARPRYLGGPFDFGDEEDFRRGVDLAVEGFWRRYNRGRACTPAVCRHLHGFRSILYRLNAKFDLTEIAEQEVRATGWDRSGYARG